LKIQLNSDLFPWQASNARLIALHFILIYFYSYDGMPKIYCFEISTSRNSIFCEQFIVWKI